MRLGDSNKPDIIVWHDICGAIIDNKSYKDGFAINSTSKDEMSRYIAENARRSSTLNPNQWWLNFDPKAQKFNFLFIASFFKGSFKKRLDYISAANDGILGGALNVENLLYFSDGFKGGKYTHADFFATFNNDEMVF